MKTMSVSAVLASVLFAFVSTSYADDFYYNGKPQYNPYNGYTVMSLPQPPPMSEVPFYVRDDYDDYVEDYYECILGYKHKGFVCRYWRKYAEKHGFYQKTPLNQINNTNVISSSAGSINQDNSNIMDNHSINSQYNQPVPYTPQH